MTGKRLLFVLLLSASIGFGLHDYISNSVLKFIYRTQLLSGKSGHETVLGQSSTEQFIVPIRYDGNSFQPATVIVKSGNYLHITNVSKDRLMWVISDLPGLGTSRGYAEGEQIQYMVTRTGTFSLRDRINTGATALIVVHP